MRRGLLILLTTALLVQSACEDAGTSGGTSNDGALAGEDTATGPDAEVYAESDAHFGLDAGPDATTAPDTAADGTNGSDTVAGADTPEDTAPDIAADIAGDIADDVADDIADDTTPDIPPPPALCEGELVPVAQDGTADDTFRRGPYVQNVSADGAVIVWLDDAAVVPEGDDSGTVDTEGCVTWDWDGAAAPETTCGEADETGQFAVPSGELPVATEVRYDIESAGGVVGPFTFHTAPDAPTPTRLLVYADAHANTETLTSIAAGALEAGVDLAVGVGDHVSQPEVDQWDRYFDGLRALAHRVVLWPVIGNHESKHPSYYAAFVVPGATPPPRQAESWYSVRWGNVWLGMLELDDIAVAAFGASAGIETQESAWLKEALASDEARSARWRLLFIHQPPYSQGWGSCDHYDGEGTLRQYLVPLAAEYGVAAIFSGHMHGWEHGEDAGVLLVTTGGAGGGLDIECPRFDELPDPWTGIYEHHFTVVDAECDRLVIEAHGLDGTVLDRIERLYED